MFRQEATKHYKDTRKQQEKRKFDPECTKLDRCGDSQHREGFRCPASNHQCSICKKIGHFSSLCYKKRDRYVNYKKSFGSPKAHQLKVKSVHTQDSLSSQSEGYSSEKDTFYLQLQVQSNEAETKFTAPQHLVTNLE